MKKIYALTDYKGYFGSKWKAYPYRSGYDQEALTKAFSSYGFEFTPVRLADAFTSGIDWEGQYVLYTSSEEFGNNYKSYIEDVVHAIELVGGIVIPKYRYLRAHNNKVFMEILRNELLGEELTGISTRAFGTLEELKSAIDTGQIQYPCIIKSSDGAMSRGVEKAENVNELMAVVAKMSRTPHYRYEFRDFLRSKWPSLAGYQCESRHQKKFIVQPMINGLDGDWKVLIYFDHVYVLNRHIRPGDFRASGSHYNYKAGGESGIPDRVLDVACEVRKRLDVPMLSIDMAYDGKRAYVIEYQCVYFGTSTQDEFSTEYFYKNQEQWELRPKQMNQEAVYAYSVAKFIGT